LDACGTQFHPVSPSLARQNMSWEKLNMHKAANQARQSGSHAAMMSLIESAWEINVMSPLRTLEIKCPRVERLHITYTHQKRVEEAILTN
jgi:hypothetical protein